MNRPAFTLTELIIVMGVFFILAALGSANLIRYLNRSSLGSAAQLVMTDIQSQQIKAMTAVTDSSGDPSPHGIYFESDKYTLFTGNAYNPAASTNYVVDIEPPVTMAASLPGSSLVFSGLGGEVSNYSEGSNIISLTDTTSGEVINLTINRYGIIVSQN